MEDNIRSQLDRADTLRQSNRVEDAIREFHRIATEAPDDDWKAISLLGIVRCHSDLGNFEDAECTLQEIAKLVLRDDISMDVSYVTAVISALKGECKKAATQYWDILQKYDQLLALSEYQDLYESICYQRATMLARSGKYKIAIDLLKEATHFSTFAAEGLQDIHGWLGFCYEKVGNNDKAIQEYLNVIVFNLGNSEEVDTRYRLAHLYIERGGYAQAKHQLETILRDYKDVAIDVPLKSVYEQLSYTCRYLGEKDNAKRYAAMSKSVDNN